MVLVCLLQRAEFSSVIKNHPKGVAGLIDAMEAKTTETTDSEISNLIITFL